MTLHRLPAAPRHPGIATTLGDTPLRQQGLAIAARTYRAWKRPARIAERTVADALVEDKTRE